MIDKIKTFQGEFRFLSNFYPSPIRIDGKLYLTVEHAFQAAKAIEDEDAESIRAVKTPGEAKRLGRLIQIRSDWDEVKLSIMRDLIRTKFYQNSRLKECLLRTNDLVLEEGNTWNDTFWGINIRTKCGENHLGHILMEIRNELRNE